MSWDGLLSGSGPLVRGPEPRAICQRQPTLTFKFASGEFERRATILFKNELKLENLYLKIRKKFYVQIDIDMKECIVLNQCIEWLRQRQVKIYFTTETNGGYHIVINRFKVPNNSQKDLSSFFMKEMDFLDNSHIFLEHIRQGSLWYLGMILQIL